MSMRNHWVEIESSSLKNDYATGPRGKADDMSIRLYQDNSGDSQKVLDIQCYPIIDEKGHVKVHTRVKDCLQDKVIFEYTTER